MNTCHNHSSSSSTCSGLTLIEVLVAMAIGLILLMGLSALFVKSTLTFKANDDFSRMQENGNFALNSISNDLRMVGFYGSIASNDISMPTAMTHTGCAAPWASKFGSPLAGFHNLAIAAATAAMPCIKASNFVDSTSILITLGASGVRVLPAALDAITIYVQSDPNGGIVFQGNNYAAFSAATKRSVRGVGGIPEEAPIYQYQGRAYYLRPCSKPTGANGACQATDDNGRPTPTLVRQELVGKTNTDVEIAEVPIAEGIEAWRVIFGVDTLDINGVAHAAGKGDGIPDIYTATPADFSRVVSARVSVLVRSAKASNGYDDSSKSYDLDGDGTTDFTCNPNPPNPNCDFHRHVFTQSLQVRNISQRFEANP